MIKLVITILIEVQANEHAAASSYNSLFPPLSKLSIFDPVRDAFDICMVTRIITCVRNLKVDLPYEYELCITQAFKHCFSNPMYQNLPGYKAARKCLLDYEREENEPGIKFARYLLHCYYGYLKKRKI